MEQAGQLLKKIIHLYNTERPHQSIGYLTPEYVHLMKTKQRNYGKIIIKKIVTL